jgi:hypothetical protein
MFNNQKKEDKMSEQKKPSELSNQLFDLTKSFSNMSRSGQLYGRLNMIKDMELYLAKEELKVKKEIEENESNV